MATKKSPAPKIPDFENSLKKLEAIVNRMEAGEMNLEESLKAFEEGVQLTRLCQETLSTAQQKVQLLMEQQGKSALKNMALNDDDDNDDPDD